MSRFSKRIALPAAIAASALALAGCSTAGDASAGGDGTLQVVATTTQMGDVVREIAGDDAQVTQLLQPGQSAHSYDPTPEALTALANADVLVINGAGLEEWLDDTIEASGFDGTLVDASEDVHLAEGDGHDHEHGDEHADEEHAEESTDASAEPTASESTDEHAGESEEEHAEHADEEGHDHGGSDPHVWTDPHQVVHMAETIGAALATASPEQADAFEASTADYVAQLEDLDAWMHESIDQVPVEQRLLVTNHDAFSYFTTANEITVVGSVLPSFDDNAEPSAADIDALVQAIRDSGVQAVFSETSIDPQLAETIGSEAGVEVYSGEDALYGDSLGAEGTDGETYVGSMIHNVTLVVESWGVEPLPVPDSLA